MIFENRPLLPGLWTEPLPSQRVRGKNGAVKYRGFLVAAAVGAAVGLGAPAHADPVSPSPVVDMSTCPSGPVLCSIYGALLGVTEVMVANTMAVLTYGLCLGPVDPGYGAIIPPVVYDHRPWCPAPG